MPEVSDYDKIDSLDNIWKPLWEYSNVEWVETHDLREYFKMKAEGSLTEKIQRKWIERFKRENERILSIAKKLSDDSERWKEIVRIKTENTLIWVRDKVEWILEGKNFYYLLLALILLDSSSAFLWIVEYGTLFWNIADAFNFIVWNLTTGFLKTCSFISNNTLWWFIWDNGIYFDTQKLIEQYSPPIKDAITRAIIYVFDIELPELLKKVAHFSWDILRLLTYSFKVVATQFILRRTVPFLLWLFSRKNMRLHERDS